MCWRNFINKMGSGAGANCRLSVLKGKVSGFSFKLKFILCVGCKKVALITVTGEEIVMIQIKWEEDELGAAAVAAADDEDDGVRMRNVVC